MYLDSSRRAPAPLPHRVPFRVTYSPAHYPTGIPINPTASRQVLAERRTTTVQAPTGDAATWAFERDTDRMVTSCTRLQDGAAEGEQP